MESRQIAVDLRRTPSKVMTVVTSDVAMVMIILMK